MTKKKIAIASHFDSFQPGYALHVGWLERARLLEYFDQDFTFFVNDKCPSNLYPHQRNSLTKIKEGRPEFAKVEHYARLYEHLFTDFDFVLTADMIYQRKGNFLAQNAAQRIAAENLNCHWLHWIHSGWTLPPNPVDSRKPEHLRFIMPPKSTIIYMNSHELPGVQKQYNCTAHDVWPVYNPKDYRSFNDFDKLSWKITSDTQIYGRDVAMLFPFCATRMDSKGIDAVAQTLAALKRRGLKVLLINAVSNSKNQQEAIRVKDAFFLDLGLYRDSDYFWSCDWTDDFKPLSRKVIADLFKVTNLFVWASWRETVGNVFQEAKISGNLMVLSKYLPSNVEMGGVDCLWMHATHNTPGFMDGRSGNLTAIKFRDPETGEDTTFDYYDKLASEIEEALPNRSYQWQFSYERIWEWQLKPLLYGREYAADGSYIKEVPA